MVFDWGFALGVVGTLISIVGLWLYLRDRPRVQLRYETRVFTLIGGTDVELPVDISISFRGVPLTVLRKVTLKVWNTGTQAIRERDIARPIRMTLPTDTLIFTQAIAKQSAPENGVCLTRSEEVPNALDVIFRYLEVGQGFNIEALYTGIDNISNVTATIIDMREGMFNVDTALKSGFWGLLTFISVAMAFGFTLILSRIININGSYGIYIVLAFASTPPCIIMLIALLQRRYQEGLSPPKDLRF